MKSLNTMKFVTNMTEELASYKAEIKAAETYESAKYGALKMLGYINCSITFLNTMICRENNDFTEAFDEVIEGWQRSLYQCLVDKSIETQQPASVTEALCRKRDEFYIL